jgi:hypothetical protein
VLLDVGQDVDAYVDVALGQFGVAVPEPDTAQIQQCVVDGIRTAFRRRVRIGGYPDTTSAPGGCAA